MHRFLHVESSQIRGGWIACRGVVRPIVKRWNLRVASEALISVLKLLTPLIIQGPNRLAKVPICLWGIQVQCLRSVVCQNPREDRVLVQVIECTPCQCVQLHSNILLALLWSQASFQHSCGVKHPVSTLVESRWVSCMQCPQHERLTAL